MHLLVFSMSRVNSSWANNTLLHAFSQMVFTFSVAILAASELRLRNQVCFLQVCLFLYLLWGVKYPLEGLSIDTPSKFRYNPRWLTKSSAKTSKAMDVVNYLITFWHKLSGFLVKALKKIFFVYKYPREEIVHQRYYFYNYFLWGQNGMILRLKNLSLSGFWYYARRWYQWS